MALIVYGMPCVLCAKPLEKGQAITSFPPFVSNELDPLYIFSDSAMHTACFDTYPLAEQATEIHNRVLENGKYGNRVDIISGEVITDPDDYFGFGYLTDDPTNPLDPYNYLHIKRSNLHLWDDLEVVIAIFEALIAAGEWQSQSTQWLMSTLSKGCK